MKEKIIPIETEYGILSGRDTIHLDLIESSGYKYTFTGQVKVNDEFKIYNLEFNNVISLFTSELDIYEEKYYEMYKTIPPYSFMEIESSSSKFLKDFNKQIINRFDKNDYKHYRLYTYDYVYDLLAKDYELNIYDKIYTYYVEKENDYKEIKIVLNHYGLTYLIDCLQEHKRDLMEQGNSELNLDEGIDVLGITLRFFINQTDDIEVTYYKEKVFGHEEIEIFASINKYNHLIELLSDLLDKKIEEIYLIPGKELNKSSIPLRIIYNKNNL